MTQRFRPPPPDRVVFVLLRGQAVLAARFDAGQFQFPAEHLGQFRERHLDLAKMALARLRTGLSGPLSIGISLADRLTDLAIALTRPA